MNSDTHSDHKRRSPAFQTTSTEAAHQKTQKALNLLGEFNRILTRAKHEAGLMRDTCRIFVEIGGYRPVWIGLAGKDKEKTVKPVAWKGYDSDDLDMLSVTPADTEKGNIPAGQAIRTGRPVVCRNILSDPGRSPLQADALKHGYAASLALPLMDENRAFGVLTIHAKEPDAFDAGEVFLLKSLSEGLAFGILSMRHRSEQLRSEKELKRHTRELAGLDALTRRVSASLSIDQVINAAIKKLIDITSPDLAILFLRKGDQLILAGLGPADARFRHPHTPAHRVGECMCGLAVSQGKALYAKDIHTDPRCTWDECKTAGLKSIATLPLLGRDRVIGVLALASGGQRDFQEQAAFLETLARHVSIGLQNALLHRHLQKHAEGLARQVAERTAALADKVRELERFNRLLVDRELRMMELKEKIRQLESEAGSRNGEPS